MCMFFRLCAILLLLTVGQAYGQTACQYLAYDGFNYPDATPLNGGTGGPGWERAWEVQGSNTAIPGYQSKGTASLAYADLQTYGRYAMGGKSYLAAGRKLDLSAAGPFAAYLSNGAIAANGQTLWMSAILRKDTLNDSGVWVQLHGDNNPWYIHNPHIGFGFIGPTSKVGSVRYWALQVNDTTLMTNTPVVAGQPVFFALSVRFDSVAGNIIQLYLNPTSLGADTPPTPTMNHTLPGALAFRSVGLYLGSDPGFGAVDELRLTDSWTCATPNPGVEVKLPPTAVISASATTGTGPLTVTLDAGQSQAVNSTLVKYEWSFGDGSPTLSGPTQATHTFANLGVATASLTVTDSNGQKNTANQAIIVRDANGSFPCLSSVSMAKRPACGLSDGSIQVGLPPGAGALLLGPGNKIVPMGASNTYSNLAEGTYQLTVAGQYSCRDSYTLSVKQDETTCPGWTPAARTLDIGMNLDGINYWSRERPFRDYMKSAGAWVTYNATGASPWDTATSAEMPTDADGYPAVVPFNSSKGPQAVHLVISTDGHMLAGDYVLLYEGTGRIQMLTVANVVATPGRIGFTVQPTNRDNIWFNILQSDAANPIHNIRIVKVSEEFSYAQNPFNDSFLDKLRPFKAIRFLNWSIANNSPVLDTWQDRTRPTRYTQGAGKGVAYEYVVDLANRLHKDVWLNVPHTASDDYVQAMALYFRDNLDPGLTVYLEYSNEVWNWMFVQTHWVDENGPVNLNYPRKYVERAVHLFKLWHAVYGSEKYRVKRVFNVQATYSWYGREVMSHAKPEDYDYISPAWYFAYSGAACEKTLDTLGAAATATDVLNCTRQNYTSQLADVAKNYLNASMFGKEVINYEGGQHITTLGTVRSFQAAIYAAQIDPQIYTLYTDALNDLRRMGSKLAMAYQLSGRRDSKYGSWGHLEDIDQPPPYLTVAPKYQVLLDNLPQ
ncbi:MAG: PKD domain-containing protein [Candidatus Methylumidiphilus sp.]